MRQCAHGTWWTSGVVIVLGIVTAASTVAHAGDTPSPSCAAPVPVGKTKDIVTALAQPSKYLSQDQYVLCFQLKPDRKTWPELSQPLFVTGADKPLILDGLQLQAAPDFPAGQSLLTVTGTNVTLRNVTLTGPGPQAAGSTGVALSGNGHQVVDSKITGFDTAIRADCAWPADAAQPDAASCTIGPQNVIGEYDPATATTTKLVNTGVHVPSTGQQVTVTQNTITTVLDQTIIADPTINTQRILLDPGANGDIAPLDLVLAPPEVANLWAAFNEAHTMIEQLLGVLPQLGTVELFLEKGPGQVSSTQFLQSCTILQKDDLHFSTLTVPDGTWLFRCDGLHIEAKQSSGSFVYSAQHHSSVYKKVSLSWIGTIPMPVATIPGTIGGVNGTGLSSGLDGASTTTGTQDANPDGQSPDAAPIAAAFPQGVYTQPDDGAESMIETAGAGSTLIAQAPTNVPGPNAELPTPDTPGIGQAPLPPAPPLGDTPLANAPTPAPPPDDAAGASALGMTGASDGGLGSAPVTAGCSLVPY